VSNPDSQYCLFINGEWRKSTSGKVFVRDNPATGLPVASFEMANREDAELAIEVARDTFDHGGWAYSDGITRADILRRAADLLIENQDKLARIETLTNGAPFHDSLSFVTTAAELFRYYSGLARGIQGSTFRFDGGTTGFTLREPIGVVSLIVPWNFPLGEVAWKLAPALAAGCTVVVKPDSKTAATALELGPILKQAGLPDGAYNVVTGDVSQIGGVLTSHESLDSISFTGSTSSGKRVMSKAAQEVIPLHLELGGKSPLIVMADADLDRAALDAAMNIFWHNGQICTATSRILCQSNIAESFVQKFKAQAEALTIGDPFDDMTQVGPLISKDHRDQVLGYIDKGIREGARLVLGGHALKGKQYDDGAFMEPTIFVDVDAQMQIAQEEIFGPVACVMSFDNIEHAIQIANDTQYGLGAGVWTASMDTAMQFTHRIRAGYFWVNGYGSARSELPWGGYKKSGFGRELGHAALEHFLQSKSVHISHTNVSESDQI